MGEAEREAERRARWTRFARLTSQGGGAFALNPAVVETIEPGDEGAEMPGTKMWRIGSDFDAEPIRLQTTYDETLRLLEEAAGGEGR